MNGRPQDRLFHALVLIGSALTGGAGGACNSDSGASADGGTADRPPVDANSADGSPLGDASDASKGFADAFYGEISTDVGPERDNGPIDAHYADISVAGDGALAPDGGDARDGPTDAFYGDISVADAREPADG